MIAITSMKTGGKEIGNVNLSARMKQLFVLIIVILIGMIISIATTDAKQYRQQKKNKTAAANYVNKVTNTCITQYTNV